ncbi:MAG TPA: alpha/beta fold hydrolase [Gemmatimonadales bacterium]|nr:alpha/beta fold hydrolase [Gemmatimonadales bacterium]
MRLLRLGFRSLQAVSPARAAALAERLFFTPPRSRLTPAMRGELERGRPFTLMVDGHRVACWSWGPAGGPVAYLVHGWGSRGGRLTAYVQPLQAAGFRVIAFDGIGHGASEGQLSSAPQLARALAALAEATGPAQAVVAHSLGAVVATLAMDWGLPVSRAAFLAPNADPIAHTLRWAHRLGMRPDVVAQMRAATERRIDFSWDGLDVVAMARRRTTPLLVVHDAADEVVPWMEGAAIVGAWRGSRFVTTRGLGHSPIVRAPEVVAQVVEFLGEAERSATRPAARVSGIEHELFYREWRPHLPAVSA